MTDERGMDITRVLDDLIETTENKRRRSVDLKVSDKVFIKECKAIKKRVLKRRRERNRE